MIPIEKEMRIRSLLSLGISGRKIAIRVKVARQTVKLIKGFPELRPRKKLKKKQQFKKLKTPRKCPECGAKVYLWPCLSCNPEIGE